MALAEMKKPPNKMLSTSGMGANALAIFSLRVKALTHIVSASAFDLHEELRGASMQSAQSASALVAFCRHAQSKDH
jgi:hypothetical protein